jgi:hypothetical protein
VQWVVVVGQDEAVVVVLARLPHAKEATLVEGVQVAEVAFLADEVVADIGESMGL